jgi:cytochrome b561/polyisoprenoid-binding protein YceI
MPASNTQSQYGSVAKAFHWLTALLILTALPLGFFAEKAPFADSEQLAFKALLFSLHKTVGVTAFFTALLRILWAMTQTRPGLLNSENRLEAFGAHTAHWLLYGSMLMVPLTGWIHHSATTGFAPIFWPFGQNLPFVPKNEALSELFSGLHFIFIIVLVLSILAHVGGALKHFVIDRDQTLQRMLPGRNSAPTPEPEAHSRLPQIAAVTTWALALIIGGATGILSTGAGHDRASNAPALAAAPSEWVVQEGQVSISVVQFGSDVTGSFADWTAAIAFNETATDGKHGEVEATIAITSLTLGSVTDQALGGDFLDATGFPTATFKADLLPAENGYVASGTLTLKGASQPLDLPFSLELEGDTARLSASTTLQRLDFGIGATMPDESSLGFPVKVDITLTATRG